MSTEASLRFKLNKKLKGVNVPKRSSKSRVKVKEVEDSDQEGSWGDAYGKRKFAPMISDRKRKRTYADKDIGENAKALSKIMQRQVKKVAPKGKNSSEHCRSIWVASKIEAVTSDRRYSSDKVKGTAGSAQSFNILQHKAREGSKLGSDGLVKKHTKSKLDSSKFFDQRQSKRTDKSPSTSAKKIVRNKKDIVENDSEVPEEHPKKRKRVIRLDPYDISNKRLDDGIAVNESDKEKKKKSDTDAKMSRNAQFRAIQPSPSILSFVEENLLGRRRLIELKRAGYNVELSAPLDNIPFSTSSERERIEENIFRNKLSFFAAAKVSSSFPVPDLPEIAFAGRSNVGKSSLLNALTRQWGVARTSDKPGLTQTINFFKLGSKLCLVDLPGYGFAYAKEEVKDAWKELVKEYVSTRVGLKRVCLLIDTKWGMKPRDHELIDLMERSQTKYQIVLTKTDIAFPIDVARRAMQIEESLKANKSIVQPVMMVSSKNGAGIRSLRTVLSKIARFAKH
uniref:Uncharacterized protein LOC105137676 n=1 Tax=Rhizophora mucronata TaxID=61149 RepID=A0A2P2JXM0_RHIMU